MEVSVKQLRRTVCLRVKFTAWWIWGPDRVPVKHTFCSYWGKVLKLRSNSASIAQNPDLQRIVVGAGGTRPLSDCCVVLSRLRESAEPEFWNLFQVGEMFQPQHLSLVMALSRRWQLFGDMLNPCERPRNSWRAPWTPKAARRPWSGAWCLTSSRLCPLWRCCRTRGGGPGSRGPAGPGMPRAFSWRYVLPTCWHVLAWAWPSPSRATGGAPLFENGNGSHIPAADVPLATFF